MDENSNIEINLIEKQNYIKNTQNKTNEEIYDSIIENYIKNYNDTYFDDLIIFEGYNTFIYQMITSEQEQVLLNGNNSSTNQLSMIDLGECENILKDHYHIDRNLSLIIVLFEKVSNFSSERVVQYEVYEPINRTKLDLLVCENVLISIYTRVTLSEELLNLYNSLIKEGYDLFDINSAFYQDYCTPFTSPNGTDVILDDRIKYYYNNNETLCQSNCRFSDYSIENKLLKCDCDISNSEINTNNIKKFSKKSLYESFYDTLKYSNYKVLKCYKLAFHKNSVTVNKGSIIAIVYFLIYLIFLILYCYKGIAQLKNDIQKIIMKNKNINKINSPLNKDEDNNPKEKDFLNLNNNNDIHKKESNQNIIIYENNENSQNTVYNLRNQNKSKTSNKNEKSTSKYINTFLNIPPKKQKTSKDILFSKTNKKSKHKRKHFKNLTQRISVQNLIIANKVQFSDKHIENIQEENQNKNLKFNDSNQEGKLDDFELNDLEYEEAIKLDKRNFIDIYWSIIKREHIIFFTFFRGNDHNLIPIKLSRLIFSICTDMAFNVFFFEDETMHKMFLDYGKYNFYQQIPQIIYSTIVSQIIEVYLCFLSLTDTYYYQIKKLEFNFRNDIEKIIKCIKIKLIFYFISTFLMFAFYWYTIACFCAVYVNTQTAFITDSISSFGLGLLYPFGLYLFPSLLRLISLRATNSRLAFLYKLSDIIPIF